jgi:Cu-processing system permease protein
MELLVAKTLTRREIFLGKWLGLSLGLGISYALGIAGGSVVNLKFSETGIGAYFLLVFLGLGLNTCFLAISFFIANLSLRKEVVFGLVMAFWFYFFILYDLLIFGVTVLGGDFPLEFPVMIMSFLNPIDLVRIILTIHMDISSMMGYTGALYSRYLGGAAGIALGSGLLIIWTILPLIWGMRFFNRRNL